MVSLRMMLAENRPSNQDKEAAHATTIACHPSTTSTMDRQQTPDPKSLPSPDVPITSRKQVSQPWDREYSNLDLEQLVEKKSKMEEELKRAWKALKSKVPTDDDESWERYLQVSRLYVESAQITSQIRLEDFNAPKEEWYDEEEARDLKLQYDSWTQWEKIMTKHKSRIQKRLADGRETFVRLFMTSQVGMNLPGAQGQRGNSLHSNMVSDMMKAYCPDAPSEYHCWEPILGRWIDRKIANAAHLFPWTQGAFMNDIFGECAINELFSPRNGLFLHNRIGKALSDGYIIIVPNVDLEPGNRLRPLDDEEARKQKVKEWEEKDVKEFKVIVVDRSNKEVLKYKFAESNEGIRTLNDLHNRTLVFRTTFRPRSRYMWWTFLNAILRVSWRDGISDKNFQHEEVRKSTRYWGTRRMYVKRNQLLGFVEEIGQDVESIVSIGPEEEGEHDQEPS